MKRLAAVSVIFAALLPVLPAAAEPPPGDDSAQAQSYREHDSERDNTFNEDEITRDVSGFFGMTTEAAAKAVERVFSDLGEPDAYIKGDEGSGAFIAGVRYGSGWL
ncbi:MAG: DUF1134 domain-containing protein, partial [Alphaproteobacteria bacterium]|nr:DUF1134 domain-containing protein [Alphaproteobacteria bacterium]